MFKRLSRFFKVDLWHVQVQTLPKWQALIIRLIRVISLTIQGFTTSQIQQGSASLTYYSLLTIVPLIALLIAIARVFLIETTFESWLLQKFANQGEIVRKILDFATISFKQASQGIIAGVGIGLLFWSSIKILINLEKAMNQIWDVRKGRPLARRFTDYLTLLIMAPFIIFLTSGLNVYLAVGFAELGKESTLLKELGHIILPLVQLIIPFFITGLLWTFLYIFIPNTPVRFLPAFFAGFITSLVYQLVQWIYYKLQIGVVSYNAVYGTFAAIPLFLIWLHLSWIITLLGAKIAFAIQNVDAYEYISEKSHLNHKFRTICCLIIAHHCIKKFNLGEPPPTPIEASNSLSIPHSLTNYLLFQLAEAGILSEVKRKKTQELAFQPARSTETLTIKQVIDMINTKGEEISLPPSHEFKVILESMNKFSSAIEQSDGNILLKDL